MNQFWHWLTTPDPTPGLTRNKLLKLATRLFIFVFIVTVLSTLLGLTPLGPYINTFWGSLIFVLVLYIPFAKFLNLDSFVNRPAPRVPPAQTGRVQQAAPGALERKRQKARYAGVSKAPPKIGGRR